MSAMSHLRQKSGGAAVAAPLPIAAPGALYAVSSSRAVGKTGNRTFSRPSGVRLRCGV